VSDDRDPHFDRRRFADAAMVLPFAGAFLLMPPLIRVFVTGSDFAGIPVVVVYLFAVWFALIAMAWWLAGPLREAMQTEPPGPGEAEPPEA
jgi:hypothetical protein